MQSWQLVVVCVAVTLGSEGALGQPRALEQESGPALMKVKEDVDQSQRQDNIWIPVENTGYSGKRHDGVPEEDTKKIIRNASQEEEDKKKNIKNLEKLQREFPVSGAEEKKDEILGSTKVDLAVSEGKDERKENYEVARSKKSTDMRELVFHRSPITTVCIQVRSDNHPAVVCGPKVEDENKDEKAASSARQAYAPATSQAQYSPAYAQRGQIPLPSSPKQNLYLRTFPQEIEPSRPSAASGRYPQQMMIPQPMPFQGSPKAARGQFLMRTTQPEEDNSLKSEDTQPAAPVQPPFRIIPQSPPSSVVVHKQYYQAAPIPSYGHSLIAPAPAPLRFNCALQPDGAQFLQPYGSPMFRNGASGPPLGYIPIGGEVIIPEVPSGRMVQDSQGFYDPQGRSANDENVDGRYEYAADPWVGNSFVGTDGLVYQIDEPQARSADYRASSPSNTMSMNELRSKYYQQEEQLAESSQKLQQLQKQLKDIQQRAAVDEEERKESKKQNPSSGISKEPGPVSTSESSDEPKKTEEKNIKRHSRHHVNRK